MRVVLAVACLAWVLAIVQKAPCVRDGWNGEDTRYAQLCYSDLPYLYVGRGFAELQVPFTDSEGRYPDLEYPVLIGYLAYGAAVVDPGGARLPRPRRPPRRPGRRPSARCPGSTRSGRTSWR